MKMGEKRNKLYVLGIGGATFARIDLANACGYSVAGLYHYNRDRTSEVVHSFPILGSFDDLLSQDIRNKKFLLTMGDMNIRRELHRRIISKGGVVPTLIHPTAQVSQFSTISPNGVIIEAQSIVQADCVIDDGVFIASQSIICHQTVIEPYVFIAPKALIGARLQVGSFAFIGQGANIVSSKVKYIGMHSVVGAGAVVVRPVEPHTTVVGSPATLVNSHQDS